MFFLLDPLTLCFANSKRLGGYTQWVHFPKKCTSPEALQSTSWLHSRKHSDYTCFYSARSGGTRRPPSSTMTRSRAWRTRVLGVPHRGVTQMGPGLAYDLLKDVRQGGMDFKLFQINLVGLLWKLDSVIGLGLFSCNRLGLDSCPYYLPYIKRGMAHLLVTLTIIQSIQHKRLHADYT